MDLWGLLQPIHIWVRDVHAPEFAEVAEIQIVMASVVE